MSEVTRILNAVQQGDPTAADQLLPLVYDELRELAAVRMANEAAGHTLQPTPLVHEAWLRLLQPEEQAQFQNRAHFLWGGGRGDAADSGRVSAAKKAAEAWRAIGASGSGCRRSSPVHAR